MHLKKGKILQRENARVMVIGFEYAAEERNSAIIFLGWNFHILLSELYQGGILTVVMEKLYENREVQRGTWVLACIFSATEKSL